MEAPLLFDEKVRDIGAPGPGHIHEKRLLPLNATRYILNLKYFDYEVRSWRDVWVEARLALTGNGAAVALHAYGSEHVFRENDYNQRNKC